MAFLKKAPYREKICELAASAHAQVIVEVGVWMGYLSQMLADVPSVTTLHLVDPWSMEYAPGSISLPRINQEALDTHHKRVRRWKHAHHKDIRIHRMTSIEAAPLLGDGSVDFIHIDGNHQYRYISKDIEIWLPKVRKGGMLTGDDYNQTGVKQAVDEQLPDAVIIGQRIWVHRT